jgi:hypothetical protein
MKLSVLLSTTLLAASAAFAVQAAAPGPVSTINITVGPDMLSETDKFAQRDFDELTAELRESLERELGKTGALAAGGGTLDLVIEDAKPNRPTMQQMTKTPGLSFQSRGIGGAKITGAYTSSDGVSTPISYSWYETDIRNTYASGTWSDAETTFDRFARRLASGQSVAEK